MYNTIFIMLEGCDSFYGEKQFANGNSQAREKTEKCPWDFMIKIILELGQIFF